MSATTAISNSTKGAAIVTGSAHGIGRAIALQLADDGYDMALNDLPSNISILEALAEEIKAKGRKALIVAGDVSQEQVVETMVDKTVAELGHLYVMVANAGVAVPSGIPVVDISLQVWERYMSINLTSMFLCYRAAARQMLKQKIGGRIIGACSSLGKRGNPRAAAYCTTKFGIRGLTQSLASELAKDNITVNAYAPGFIDTPLLEGIGRQGATTLEQEKKGIEAIAAYARSVCPMGKLGTPENVAALVSYIVSDKADFMTGKSAAS